MIVTLQQSKDGTFQYDERARRSHRCFRRWAMALVSLLLLAGCSPSDEERLWLCPINEKLNNAYDQSRALRTLKGYEEENARKVKRYVEKYCQ